MSDHHPKLSSSGNRQRAARVQVSRLAHLEGEADHTVREDKHDGDQTAGQPPRPSFRHPQAAAKVEERDKWPTYRDWAVETAGRLKSAVQSRVDSVEF